MRRRGRRSERGFALVAVVALAILFFALMQLVLLESSETMRQAQRFRARTIAQTLAENGAELAATRMVEVTSNEVDAKNNQGTMRGTYLRTDDTFRIDGTGSASGPFPAKASVTIWGHFNGTQIVIDRTVHSQ